MDTSTLIWIIIGIIVVAAIIVIVWFVTKRGRREAQLEAQRHRAAEMRSTAADTDLAAREREAEALRADAAARKAEADAAQARADAERLARESSERQEDAQRLRTEAEEHLRKADEVDPDARPDERQGGLPADDRFDAQPTHAARSDEEWHDTVHGDGEHVDAGSPPRHASAARTAEAEPLTKPPAAPVQQTADPRTQEPRTGA